MAGMRPERRKDKLARWDREVEDRPRFQRVLAGVLFGEGPLGPEERREPGFGVFGPSETGAFAHRPFRDKLKL